MHMDLSKAFDTIKHDFLFAKLQAHGFPTNALKLLYSYLKNRKQIVVIYTKTRSSEVIIAGVAQGSVNGLLLLNLFINDLILLLLLLLLLLLYKNKQLSNYATLCFLLKRTLSLYLLIRQLIMWLSSVNISMP